MLYLCLGKNLIFQDKLPPPRTETATDRNTIEKEAKKRHNPLRTRECV
jgi:hypothetical protein